MFFDTTDLASDEIFLKLKTAEANPNKRLAPAYYFKICLLDGTEIGFAISGWAIRRSFISAAISVIPFMNSIVAGIMPAKHASCYLSLQESTV